MGPGASISLQTMPVKPPGPGWITLKRLGVGHVIKGQAESFQGRVGFPKTLVAAKIRQSRVNSDTGPGPDPQAIGLGNHASSRLNAHFPESRSRGGEVVVWALTLFRAG